METSRIELRNHEFEGDNNVYLLESGGEKALVDTGVSTPDVHQQLKEGLSEHGYGFGDIDTVLVTHWHADHSGLAGAIQRESGGSVLVHEEDAPIVRGDEYSLEGMRSERDRLISEWGMPDDERDQLVAFLDGMSSIMGNPPDVETFEDGDTISVGEDEVEVLHSPGHTSGLCCFVHGETVFSGDALLPVYTPNVGGADVRTTKPLDSYLDTLLRMASRDFEVAYPGHRKPIKEPTERANETVEHHYERSCKIVGVLDENGPCDAWTVGAHLFGSLNAIHILHGPGESYAHLDHMERNGVVESSEGVPVEYNLAMEVEEAEEVLSGTILQSEAARD